MILAGCELNGRSGHEVGRELLARLYRSKTGRALPPVQVTERGKPYLADHSLHFSITHTKNHVFCALSEENIGIDAEELTRTVRPELAYKILSPAELAQYEAAADQNRALLTFWVLKEATAKLSGEGLRGYPNRTDFRLDDPRVTERDGCLLAVLRQDESP